MSFIVNTTVMSNFASIYRLDLIKMAFSQLYISTEVYEEIQMGLSQGYYFYDNIDQHIFPLSSNGWLQLTSLQNSEELHLFGTLLTHLHSGEASAIAIARYRNWTFLSDDKAARKVATTLQVAVSGTLGILLLLVEDKYISLNQADELLTQMVSNGYHSPVKSLHSLIYRS